MPPVTDDRNDPALANVDPATGMQETYLVLSAADRAAGFVRPVRRTYVHKKCGGVTTMKCGGVTTMGVAIAETYARNPSFYGATYCAVCRDHVPVGVGGEFVWDGADELVGT